MTVASTLRPLPLKSVRLLPGTPFARAEKTNLDYLNMCAPDGLSAPPPREKAPSLSLRCNTPHTRHPLRRAGPPAPS